MRKRWYIWVGEATVAAVGMTFLFLAVPLLKARFSSAESSSPKAETNHGPRLVAAGTVRLETDVVDSLGIKIGAVKAAQRTQLLPPLLGSLTLDPDKLARVQARFPCEVISIGTTTAPATYEKRPLAFGDDVKAGTLLAVLACRE